MNSTTLTNTVKLIIIGQSGVGKTNILLRLCDDDFRQNYVATIGVDFKLKLFDIHGRKIKMQIWDTAGQQRFKTINQTYYKNASGIVLAYAINDFASFRKIEEWIKQVTQFSPPTVHKILLGNKCDIMDKREVKEQDGRQLAEKFGMAFLEVSAKDGTNILEGFMMLGRKVKENLETQEKQNGLKLSQGKKKKNTECNC